MTGLSSSSSELPPPLHGRGSSFGANLCAMLPANSIRKLNDHFGLYVICANCETCLHFWEVEPAHLARQFGWEALFADVIATLHCPRCQAHPCHVEVGFDQRPRKWGRDQ
jgi:hypothetical protein